MATNGQGDRSRSNSIHEYSELPGLNGASYKQANIKKEVGKCVTFGAPWADLDVLDYWLTGRFCTG